MRAFAILLAAFAGVLPQERQEPPQPLFRSSSSELVVLPVVVSSKRGTYVSDLPRERFAVFDNGRRVAIDFFSNEDTPVTIGLVVDASGSMGPKVGEVVAGAFAFARSSNPDDELFAMQFNDDVRDLLPDRRFLLASDHESLARALAAIRPIGRTALYDALDAALDRLDSGTRPRKALVVISDGGDNASRATLDSVLARARKSNAAIYTIGLFDEGDPDRNPRLLKQLAKTTGGERFLPESAGPLLTACEHIAREIRSGYTIGYAPPVRDGAFHRIRVVIDPPDSMHLDVRTRPGYFAGREGAQR